MNVDTVLKECYQKETSSSQSDNEKGGIEYHEPGQKRPKSKNAKEGNASAGQRSKVFKKSETAVRPVDDNAPGHSARDDDEIVDDAEPSSSHFDSPQRCSDDRRGKPPGRRSPYGRHGKTSLGSDQRRPKEDSEEQSPRQDRGANWNAGRSFRGGRPSTQASWRGRPTRGHGGQYPNRERRANMLAQILDCAGY